MKLAANALAASLATILVVVASTTSCVQSAHAQSIRELREELERERLLAEIESLRAQRQRAYREDDARESQHRINQVAIEREEQERNTRQRSDIIRNANELVSVVGNAAYLFGRLK